MGNYTYCSVSFSLSAIHPLKNLKKSSCDIGLATSGISSLIISQFRKCIAASWLANTATLELSISSQFVIWMCLSFLVDFILIGSVITTYDWRIKLVIQISYLCLKCKQTVNTDFSKGEEIWHNKIAYWTFWIFVHFFLCPPFWRCFHFKILQSGFQL